MAKSPQHGPKEMKHLVKEDLGLERRVIVPQEMRKEMCHKLLNNAEGLGPDYF